MAGDRRYVNPWVLTTIIVGASVLIGLVVILPLMQQARLIQQIEAGGGRVYLELTGPKWKTELIEEYELRRLFGTPVDVWIEPGWTDGQLRQVSRWREVRSLDIVGGTLTRTQFQDVAHLKNLEWLGLYGVSLEAGGLVQLASLPSLRELALEHIAGLTDDDLADVAVLSELEWLSVSYAPQVTGTMLNRLPAGLEVLFLVGTGITDERLAGLRHLQQLERLYLNNTSITDAGLIPLKHLHALRGLSIHGTAITDAGVAELKRHLPNVEIER